MPHFHGMTLQWLGHATFHLQTPKGTSILIDPWLESNPSFPYRLESSRKNRSRALYPRPWGSPGRCIARGSTLSSNLFIGIYELTGWLTSKGVKKTVGMNLGGAFRFQDVTVVLVEAKHSSSIEDQGNTIYAGVAAGYVLQVDGEPTMYHSGEIRPCLAI